MDTIIYDKIDEVQGKVEYNGGGINSLKTDMTAVKADLDVLKAKGAVKSVQRGMLDQTINIPSSQTKSVEIPISSVNVERSILMHSFANRSSGTGSGSGWLYKAELSSTKITVTFGAPSSSVTPRVYGEWQVIEFY